MEDHVAVNRCLKCSRYNHRASNCRGEETCPLCTGGHKDCTASSGDYKCINCVNFNKYNGNAKVCENHSYLDKSCPSLQAVNEIQTKHRLLKWHQYALNSTRKQVTSHLDACRLVCNIQKQQLIILINSRWNPP
jgi:phage FluMu protein Com